ncbi:putative baseplate assembly protein [Dyella tabacisoli]|uniref:Putative baseplate assembly protein n=1 Tax=Dyella tabacisoli TaxID=2282381 RepID=A0A369UNR6_9GAMM|nr:putative baseplate assembly protein [Dyella tabacisoli]RDD82117.1 putative baseplate assembly protein [Dyella tabacisoli]
MTMYMCCDQNRRTLVRGGPLNGIDWLDVVDLEAATPALRQRQLRLGFVNSPPPAGLTPANFVIGGGERIVGISVDQVSYDGTVVVLHLTAYGDFSPYLLSVIGSDGKPLSGLDPLLASITFGFKVECPADIDCQQTVCCEPAAEPLPPIDYLAKDYTTFRQQMLDRMSVTAPSWTERNEADPGIALVEVLAYVADHLSYQQDAIATEAYLGTARRRVSVRRHAKLVDYAMHDGCNARAWVVLQVTAAADGKTLPGPQFSSFPPRSGSLLLTRLSNTTVIDLANRQAALSAAPTCFETMHDLVLYSSLNTINFYTWGDARCCLPRGSTSATLLAPATAIDLRGRVLILQEMRSPTTGLAADADASHRQALRVVTQDPLPGQPVKTDPVTGASIVDITWDNADALTFPLCISSLSDAAHGGVPLDKLSIAWGNVVLADHGLSQAVESLGTMPEPTLYAVSACAGDNCQPAPPNAIPARFNPSLAQWPLTQQGHVIVDSMFEGQPEAALLPFDPAAPASAAMQWDIANTLPAMALASTGAGGTELWTARHDLLESTPTSADVVVEIDSDMLARLRFGDDEYGLRPVAGDTFATAYRIGNGVAGLVGANSIAHVATPLSGALPPGILSVTNPLPAQGGIDPESIDSVLQAAPAAFLVQERAVTSADYAAVSLRNPLVSAASADFRWTGSWYTVFDTVDRPDGLPVDAPFTTAIRSYLERYRVIGHDLQVNAPSMVPLRIDMQVCVRVPWFRADIEIELRRLFGTGTRSDGSPAFFNPDLHNFGETLYLSNLYALAQAVPGVDAVEITRFERLYQASDDGLNQWKLKFASIEIPRCDNDPNFPGHGVLNLTVRGGQ